MHPELLRSHLSRRAALGLGAAAAATLATSGTAGAATPAAAPVSADGIDDVPFDFSDLAAWIPGPYGPDDQRGALAEVTPEKTARALRAVSGGRGVTTYNLGELMWNGFPGFVTTPPRVYDQRLTIGGYTSPEFEAAGGIVQFREPLGVNRISLHEERFGAVSTPGYDEPFSTTFQLGTQLDGLNHVGFGDVFYNGNRGPDIDRVWGTTKLDNETVGPIVTRGVLLDVLGVKIATGDTAALGRPAADGRPVLASNYRITVEDLRAALDFGGISRIEPGDAVLIRTGWSHLLTRVDRVPDQADITRWMATEGLPGIYLREARWLARHRPVLIGSDTWALEVLGNPVNGDGTAFPVHQDLILRHGIRINESVRLDGLARDRVHEFTYVVTPQFSEGATCGNTPPAALGRPRR